MRKPARDRRGIEEVRVEVAFEQDGLAVVDRVYAELEVVERLWRLDAGDGNLAEIERAAELVDVEDDRHERRAARIAGQPEFLHERAEREALMRLRIKECPARRAQVLGERLLRIDAATQRDRVDAVRDEMAVLLQRLARHRHADDEIVDGREARDEHFECGEQRDEQRRTVLRGAGPNGLVELLVDREHLPAGGVGLERGPRAIER